jgi:hypothetical protein
MRSKTLLSLLCLFYLNIFNGISQNQDPVISKKEYREKQEDPYIRVNRSDYRTTPAYNFNNEMITTYQVNVNAEGNNMLGDAANEPSIAIDPTNPQRMVIGWRQFDTVLSNFRQAGYAFTDDAGQTWSYPGVIEEGVFRSDPVLDFDKDGRFYYNSLGLYYRCDVFRTINGTNWDTGSFAFGGDKQWMAIDRTNNNSSGNIYALWKDVLSYCDGGFTYSFNLGDSFETCDPLPRSFGRGTLATGPAGELFICGELNGNIYIAKSTNTDMDEAPIEWVISKQVDLGGQFLPYIGPNPGGLLGQVWVAVDHSDGPDHGSVYLLSTLRTKSDSADVMFARSTDGGKNWGEPTRINDDGSNHWNWFGTLSVAPNGRIDAAWLDSRDTPNSTLSALYFSYSKDGGITWAENIKLSEPFDPHAGYPNQEKLGDYFHMLSDAEGAHLAWAGTFNGEQDVYYSRIQVEEVTSTDPSATSYNEKEIEISVFPNPFDDVTEITYSIKEPSFITLEIVDILGKRVRLLKNEYLEDAINSVQWDGNDDLGKSTGTGVHFCILSSNHSPMTSKKVVRIE